MYKPTEPAQWIWYPGDFEFYLGLRVQSERWERLAQITTEWKMETFYPNVRFRSPEFVVAEPVTFKIYTTGTCCVQVDNGWYYQYDHRTGLTLEPGTHSLMVTVFNAHELPSVYVDAPCIHTDKYWEVTCGDFEWFPVGSWNFTDRQITPSDFRLETTPVQPVEIRQVNDGVFYDFGRELMAFVKGTQVTGKGTVHISYGESDTEALDVEGCEAFDELEADGDFVAPQTRAFRYIFVQTGGDLAIGHIEALYEYLPLENKGDFRCDDERLNRIYEVALHTLHLNSREFFLDGIKRDHWVWSGDATQSYLLNFYSFNDNAICQRTMRFLRGKDPLKTHMNTIQDYTLYWFISLYDYYLYTNDTEFFLKMYPSAKKLMEEFCFKFVDERGFLVAQPGDWVFIDWVEMENRDKGDISFIQILFTRALEAMQVMAGIYGDTEGEQRYGRLSKDLLKKCFEVFWSEKHHAFTHHPASDPHTIVTRYANMFALMFGYLSDEQREQVIQNVILNDDVIAITTPYMKFYELMALCEAGRFDTVRQYISDYSGKRMTRTRKAPSTTRCTSPDTAKACATPGAPARLCSTANTSSASARPKLAMQSLRWCRSWAACITSAAKPPRRTAASRWIMTDKRCGWPTIPTAPASCVSAAGRRPSSLILSKRSPPRNNRRVKEAVYSTSEPVHGESYFKD